jgi:hypothetical protein
MSLSKTSGLQSRRTTFSGNFVQLPKQDNIWYQELHKFVSCNKELLPTNVPPMLTDRELAALRAHLIVAQDVSYSEASFPPSNYTLEVDNASELDLHRLVDDAQCLLAPTRTLPSDLIHEIFIRAGEETPGFSVAYNQRATALSNGPWALSHVCRQWKNVALYAVHWLTIKIDYHIQAYRLDHHPIPSPSLMKLLSCGLERSGSNELHIYVNIHNYWPRPPRDLAQTKTEHVIAHLLRSSVRIVKLQAIGPRNEFYDYGDIFGNSEEISFPALRHLHLCHIRPYCAGESWKASFKQFAEAQALTHLRFSFSYIEGGDGLLNSSMPWHQLKHLTYEGDLDDYTILALVRLCPRLAEFCSGTYSKDYQPDDARPQSITHKSLQALHLSGRSDQVLEHLTLPRLQHLSCLTTKYSTPLIYRSRCSLSSLHLQRGSDDTLSLDSGILLQPSVASLAELVLGPSPLQVVSVLLFDITAVGDLLPSLWNLEVTVYQLCSRGDAEDLSRSFVDVIASRPTIQCFKLYHPTAFIRSIDTENEISPLETYVEEYKEDLLQGIISGKRLTLFGTLLGPPYLLVLNVMLLPRI